MMRIKQNNLIILLIVTGVSLLFASACKENEDDKDTLPVLTTVAVTDITQTTAKSGGEITSIGGAIVTECGVCWSTSQTPTISDNKTTEGIGAVNFVSSLTGLSANTSYYVRAYATNSFGTGYGSALPFTTREANAIDSCIDPRDGNVYHYITIGTQVWMIENLRYLPSVVGSYTASRTKPYYYVTGYSGTNVNDAKATEYYSTYGVLYNWPAAVIACPEGWHLPDEDEWAQLFNYLGGRSVAGGKLKEIGTIHWSDPNTGATNASGFSALPGGYRSFVGSFEYTGDLGCFWSATEEDTENAWKHTMYCNDNGVDMGYREKDYGFSVRCIKD